MAKRIARAISANVDRFYSDSISFVQFNRNQDRLWRVAERLSVAESVTELVRPPLFGSAYKRAIAVTSC